ncbi:ABC transporter substrate-binding protein [Roseomonas sp. NAR14]|uniref:ABC transporter substrate-binding protein n=1 Tax=Roseomonas acroporae TaxID=2937791 RepID=A0A9X1YGM0_9PROT|nr:ABC transporter substrate-binding protein [Roseomonas acroporae]MCK8785896.1 ABC transporter substrate-binding protein [Roseomonas acroporae]
MTSHRPTRRAVLGGLVTAGALATPALLARPANTQSLRRVTLTLPWVAEGSNLFAFVARMKGYWSDQGLDVQISRGYGSVAAAQATGAGQFDFGIAASSSLIQQAAKNLPLVGLACSGYDAQMGIGVLAGSPIAEPRQLEGKQLGGTTTSGEYPFLPAFAQRAGFDLSKVRLVTVDPQVRQRILADRTVDAICGFAGSIAPSLAAQGVQTRFMLYSAFGMRFYGNYLMTQRERLRTDAALCDAVARGLMQGMKFALLDPAESIRLFMRAVPEMALTAGAQETIRVGLGIFRYSAIPPAEVQDQPLGYTPPQPFDGMIDMTMAALGAAGDQRPRLADIMTNEHLGGVSMSEAELKQARDGAAEFGRYLR